MTDLGIDKAAQDLLLFRFNESERRCVQLEKTLRWLLGTMSNQQDDIVYAVLQGETLETAIKEYTETEN